MDRAPAAVEHFAHSTGSIPTPGNFFYRLFDIENDIFTWCLSFYALFPIHRLEKTREPLPNFLTSQDEMFIMVLLWVKLQQRHLLKPHF